MKTLKLIVKCLTIVIVTLLFQALPVHAEAEYITVLDITVVEHENGNVAILQIGRYSPFRRYSWFRAGDIIVEINGIKTTTFILNSLDKKNEPFIKFKRGADPEAERQISLRQPVFGLPPYLNNQ